MFIRQMIYDSVSGTTVKISELPLSIQNQIPNSIRFLKDEYVIRELPFDIQNLVEDYLSQKKEVQYKRIFDCIPYASKYGDLAVIDNICDLIVEYLKNYFTITPKDYPWDPKFGSRIKYYLHNLDSATKHQLINTEVSNIVNTISSDLNLNIQVISVSITDTTENGFDLVYNVKIAISINNSKKNVNLSILKPD